MGTSGALAADPVVIQPMDYENEHCSGCGFVTTIERLCYDGRVVTTYACTVHSGCNERQFRLGCKRTCNTASHVRFTNGDHIAQRYHTLTGQASTIACPYKVTGEHVSTIGW